jgi:hypothetical protein
MHLGFDEIDDIEVNVFDIDDGGQEQDVADPADDEEIDGEQDPDVADPGEPERDTDEGGNAGDDGAGDSAPEKQPLTPDERHAAAKARRDALDQQIYARARADVQKELDAERKAMYASLGLTDPYNDGKAIETKEEYDAYIRNRDADQLKRALRNGTATPEMLYSAIDRRLSEREQPAAAAQAEEQAPNVAELNRQYAMLTEIEVDVPPLDELGQDAAFVEALKETGHLVRAYQKVKGTQRMAEEAAKAVAQDRQKNAGKAHLRKAGAARGSGGVEVTREMIEYYHRFDPTMTVEEIRANEEAYHGQKGR